MFLPGLHIPSIMHEMNYGCGSTVHLQDMTDGQRVLYVGVGGGLAGRPGRLGESGRLLGGVSVTQALPATGVELAPFYQSAGTFRPPCPEHPGSGNIASTDRNPRIPRMYRQATNLSRRFR